MMNSSENQAQMEMPKYKCYKEVWALKIAKIEIDSGSPSHQNEGNGWITPEETGYARFPVEETYFLKHKPEVGGYYVVYKDGYKSYSPAKAFEDGYTKINN